MAGSFWGQRERDPNGNEESELRQGLRDILRATPDVRDDALLAEVKRLKKKVESMNDGKGVTNFPFTGAFLDQS